MIEPLNIFQRLTMFAGLFFSSAAGVVEGGAGGESEAGGAAAEAEGSEAGETAEVTEGAEGAEGTEATEGETGEAVETSRDGRNAPDAVKKALAKLRESDRETHDILRKEIFKSQQDLGNYRGIFKDAAEARAAADTIESLGGEEGIAKLQGEVNDYSAELTKMANGDPSVVEDLARDFPKGLLKLAPAALDRMRQIDSGAYERIIARHMVPILRDKGVTNSIDRVLELISDGKQAAAHDMALKVRQWMEGVSQLATTELREQEDPRQKELDEREQTLNQQKDNIFRRQVASTIVTRMNSAIEKALVPYLKTRKLSLEQKKGLASGIYTQISESLQAKSSYQQRLKALLDEGDSARVARFVDSNVGQLVAKATSREWSARGFSTTTRLRDSGNGAATITKGSKPPADQIDWSKDRSRMRFISGEATLLPKFGGKIIKWDVNAI